MLRFLIAITYLLCFLCASHIWASDSSKSTEDEQIFPGATAAYISCEVSTLKNKLGEIAPNTAKFTNLLQGIDSLHLLLIESDATNAPATTLGLQGIYPLLAVKGNIFPILTNLSTTFDGCDIKTNSIAEKSYTTCSFNNQDALVLDTFFKHILNLKRAVRLDKKNEGTQNSEKEEFSFYISSQEDLYLIEPEGVFASSIFWNSLKNTNDAKLTESPVWQQHQSNLKPDDSDAALVLKGWGSFLPFITRWLAEEELMAKDTLLSEKKESKKENDETQISEEESVDQLPLFLGTVGLNSFLSGSFRITLDQKGITYYGSLTSPKSKRWGLCNLFSLLKEDSMPPEFIRDSVQTYSRTRINVSELWDNLAEWASEVMPTICDIFSETFLPPLKEKNPDFDIKKSFILPIQNDCITATYANNQTLYFVKSSNPEGYIKNIKSAMSIIAPFPCIETEIKKHTIVSIPVPDLDLQLSTSRTNYYHISMKDDYLIFSPKLKNIEFFFSENTSAPLVASEQLKKAIEYIGGSNSGYLKYKNLKVLLQYALNDEINKEQPAKDEFPFSFFVDGFLSPDKSFSEIFKKLFKRQEYLSFQNFIPCLSFQISTIKEDENGYQFCSFIPLELSAISNTEPADSQEDTNSKVQSEPTPKSAPKIESPEPATPSGENDDGVIPMPDIADPFI